jgi:23S rRNA pseudouridine1911/1915/1917 synthase
MSEEIIPSEPLEEEPESAPTPDAETEIIPLEENGPEHMQLHVGHGIRERRIDKYLQGRFGQFSRTTIQKIIKEEAVKVNGRPVKPSMGLSPGDIIDLILPPLPVKELIPEDIPLNIIYEDDDIIVLNKQADLIVHPARGNTHGTLVNALAFHSEKLSKGSGEFRPGIVHRLDRNTTGVMVVAKTDTAHWRISHQFEYRQTKKTYLAIAHGVPELTADVINKPLGVHPKIREKYAIRPEMGKEAVTFYEVMEAFKGFSLLKLSPKTGRTHQIRVHLSYIKHPIIADDMYGGKLVYPWQLKNEEAVAEDPIISRCALHAYTLEFKHPITNEPMSFTAELPPDMKNCLEMLRQYRAIKKK